MKPKTQEAMQQLFAAKWNVPKAAEYCGLTWREMKITFSAYCAVNKPTYAADGSRAKVEEEG